MPFPFRFVLLSGALVATPVAADTLNPPQLIAESQTGDAPTPMDQGTSAADVKVTQSVRQALTANDKLSINAQNVKIITRDGVVTLRGAVNDAHENATVVAAAKATSGVKRVDDQLQIQTQ
jgi:hyperosmotically inducible periplasmic protein